MTPSDGGRGHSGLTVCTLFKCYLHVVYVLFTCGAVSGDSECDAGKPPSASRRHLQPDGDGMHRAQQEHVHAKHHQTGSASIHCN